MVDKTVLVKTIMDRIACHELSLVWNSQQIIRTSEFCEDRYEVAKRKPVSLLDPKYDPV